MLCIGFPAQAFDTNCYVLAPGRGGEAIVVDPGIGVVEALDGLLRELELRPVAVLATHGHADHVFSVTPVCGAHDVPALIHEADRYRLKDPVTSLGPELSGMLAANFGAWREPDDVRTLADGERLDLAGLTLRVTHAPGHTEGSMMFAVDGVPDQVTGADVELTSTLLSGDVLFAGSIGRTDLPGGDHAAMQASLRERVLTRPDTELVLPGHGGATTIGHERRSNPFLQSLG